MIAPITSVAAQQITDDHRTAAEEFVQFFAEGLQIGNQERFLTHFESRLHPEHTMTQPLLAKAYGLAGFRRMFTPVWAAIPDLHGEVHRWGATADGVLIEFTLRGTLGHTPVEWPCADRFSLRDGLMCGMQTYFDPLPLLPAALRHPIVALRLLPRLRRTEPRH